MTDFADLVMRVDSTGVKAGASDLDRLTTAGAQAEAQTGNLAKTTKTASAAAADMARQTTRVIDGVNMSGKATVALAGATNSAGKEWVKASSEAGRMRIAAEGAAQANNKLAASARGAGAAASKMAADAQLAAAGMTKTSGAGRVLGQQLSQVAQQAMASGNVLQALAIQLPDIAVGMGTAGASAGRFAAFMGGPWGIAIATATAVLLPLIGRLFDTASAADTATAALRRQRQERLREMEEARTLTDGLGVVNKLRREERDLLLEIKRVNPNNLTQADGSPMFANAQWQKLKEVRKELAETSEDMSRKVRELAPLNKLLTDTTDKAAAATTRHAGASRGAGAALRAQSAAAREAEKATKLLNDALTDGTNTLDKLIKDFQKDLVENFEKQGLKDLDGALDDLKNKQEVRIQGWAEAQEQLNRRLEDTVGYLRQIGGLGNTLGDVVGILNGLRTGDFSMVGGQLGGMIGLLKQSSDGRAMLSRLGDGVNGFLGKIGTSIEGLSSAIGAFGVAVQANKMIGDVLGFKGGPLGIFTSLFNKLFSSAKKGKATFGPDLSISTGGNSNKRIEAASGLAGGVTDALSQIADALGVSLGSFTGTIGIRNKSLRYDPTGMGNTKTSKGAIDFGQDQEALIKAVIKDAISDGVFEGLSEGVERILKGPGDIEKNLQSALTYKGIGDSLMAMKDPTGAAYAELDKQKKAWLEAVQLAGNSAEDIARVEELYGLRRVEIAKQALEATRPAREQEVRILELLGKDQEALAASRQLELDMMDPLLREKEQYIYRLEDQIAAEAKMRAIAEEQAALNLRYYQAAGDEAKVLQIQRNAELAAVSEGNRALLLSVYAREDEAKATAEAARIAQEAAEAAKRISEERAGLEQQLMTLMGDTNGLRAIERAKLDESNRALFDRINALADEKAATEAAAAAARAIADEHAGLMQELYQVTGNTAALRALELEKLDPSNRALKQYIWSLQDAQAASEAAAKAEQDRASAMEALRSRLTDAYQRESGALQGTIDKFNGFSLSIQQFRDNLLAGSNPAFGFSAAQRTFRSTARMAGLGNETSLAAFQGDAQAYLDTARNSVSSGSEYRRILAEVLGASNGAISGASGVAGMAAKQLDVMTRQYQALVSLDEKQDTFADALADYQNAIRAELIPSVTETISTSMDNVAAAVTTQTEDARTANGNQQAALDAMALAIIRLERKINTVIEDDEVKVTITNTTTNAVPVDQI